MSKVKKRKRLRRASLKQRNVNVYGKMSGLYGECVEFDEHIFPNWCH